MGDVVSKYRSLGKALGKISRLGEKAKALTFELTEARLIGDIKLEGIQEGIGLSSQFLETLDYSRQAKKKKKEFEEAFTAIEGITEERGLSIVEIDDGKFPWFAEDRFGIYEGDKLIAEMDKSQVLAYGGDITEENLYTILGIERPEEKTLSDIRETTQNYIQLQKESQMDIKESEDLDTGRQIETTGIGYDVFLGEEAGPAYVINERGERVPVSASGGNWRDTTSQEEQIRLGEEWEQQQNRLTELPEFETIVDVGPEEPEEWFEEEMETGKMPEVVKDLELEIKELERSGAPSYHLWEE